MEPEVRENKNVFFTNKRLKLSRKCLTDDAVKDVARSMKRSRDITELDLSYNQIEARGAKYLGLCLKGTAIHMLDLQGNKLGDDGLANLALGLEGSNVRYLDLGGNGIGPRGVFHLCQVLSRTRVRTLNLSINHIGNIGAEFLGQCLKFTQISNLYFGLNGVEDKGLICLVQGLKGSQIKVLGFSGNHFGDDCLRSFAESLKDTQVEEISLDGMGIDAARYLHAILPESRLQNYRLEVSTNKSSNCIFQFMTSLDGIKMFNVFLNDFDIGYDGAAYLNELFQKFPLHSLSFSNQELKAVQVQCLAQAFENIKIDCLEFEKCHLAQLDGMRFLVEILKNSQISRLDNKFEKMKPSDFQCLAGFLNEISVMELCLRHSDLNDECLPYLVSALRTNTIIKLDLSSNQITSTGTGDLAPVFEHNQITHLNLSDNAIGDLGAKHLSNYLKHSQLKYIDISENGITEVGYQHLVRTIDDTNVSLIRCSSRSDIQRDETATTAHKVCRAFKALVGLTPFSNEYEFVLPKEMHDFLIDEYVFFIKVLTEHPQVKAHIFNMMCFRETCDDDCVDFDTMNQITKFIDKLSDKFNEFFNENLPALPACDYVELTEKFETMQQFDIVQNLLLHRELFYVDSNKEFLHPVIYRLLYRYKMPLYNEELEPNKKNAILAFYENYSDENDVKELIRLLM